MGGGGLAGLQCECIAQGRAGLERDGLERTGRQPPAPATGPVKGSVLVLNGADDPMVSEDSLKAFKQEMDGAGADWQLTHFGGAVHSFTDPGANIPGRSVYDPKVARRAFAAMDDLFNEVFGA